MEQQQILEKLQEIFCNVFDNDEITVSLDSALEDFDEWDSLTHVLLMNEISKAFSVEFTTKEISGIASVKDIITILQEKTK